MEWAGLIKHGQCGPDIPMDAKIIARLPLSVKRRIIPEPTAESHCIEALNDAHPPGIDGKWVLHEWVNSLVGEFWLAECDGHKECPECDGDGYFFHWTHQYECEECDGSGESDEETYVRNDVRFVRWDGVILPDHPVKWLEP